MIDFVQTHWKKKLNENALDGHRGISLFFSFFFFFFFALYVCELKKITEPRCKLHSIQKL